MVVMSVNMLAAVGSYLIEAELVEWNLLECIQHLDMVDATCRCPFGWVHTYRPSPRITHSMQCQVVRRRLDWFVHTSEHSIITNGLFVLERRVVRSSSIRQADVSILFTNQTLVQRLDRPFVVALRILDHCQQLVARSTILDQSQLIAHRSVVARTTPSTSVHPKAYQSQNIMCLLDSRLFCK
jgi:hypothetical protein